MTSPSVPAFRESAVRQYAAALGVIAVTTGVSLAVVPLTGYFTPSIFYLFALTFLGTIVDYGALLISALISALLWDFLFIPPRYTLDVDRLEDALMLTAYFVTATTSSVLTWRIRRSKEKLAQEERRMSVLYALSGDLAKSTNVWQSADAAARHMKLAFAVPCAIILESRGGIERYPVNVAASSEMKTKETAVAEWVIRNGRQAGRFTDTLLDAPARFVPMVTQGGVVGAARIELSAPLDPTGESLLQTMVDQAALSIERHRLAQREQELRMADESDRLSRILMNTVSHELRSPLTAIMGASSALLDESVAQNPEVRRGLLDELWNSAARLNRLVNNLLDMSRLESGHMRIRHFPVSLHDVVEECLATYKRDLEGHNVVTDLAGMTGTISADYELLVQAVGCVIHNAAVHTPAGTSIFIKAGTSALDQAWLTVEDDGSGVSDEEIAGLFDRFYGGRRTRGTGAGLGLSLAKGIFELHGGSLTAERRQPHGLRFSARVPATQPSRQAGAGGDQT